MTDATDAWHTFAEAEGAEYLAAYVTIWRCPACSAVVGTDGEQIEWVLEPEAVLSEE